MQIPKTVSEFKAWAKKTRKGSQGIIYIGSALAFNVMFGVGPDSPSKDQTSAMNRLDKILAIVAEECAIRWCVNTPQLKPGSKKAKPKKK